MEIDVASGFAHADFGGGDVDVEEGAGVEEEG